AFRRAGLRVAALQHAVGEVEKLGRELVAFGEAALAAVAVDRQPVLERRGVVVGRLEQQVALGADDAVLRDLRGAEAADEARQALVREAQQRADRLLDVADRAGGDRARLERLLAEERARRV